MNLFNRRLNILESNSFFLFGARGVGKTRLLESLPFLKKNCLWIDLLKPAVEKELSLHPERLDEMVTANTPNWVVIDEVQRVPQLLDIVHDKIEHTPIKFALSGSSARKLKRGGANLLSGRAFVYNLYPLTCVELGSKYDLRQITQFGTLPKLFTLKSDEERALFLDAYVDTYLREEVIAEQLVRNLVPFRRFLEIAGQMSGMLVNYSAIADNIGVDSNTVRSYFGILEDTLIGFMIPAWDRSIRKQQIKAPRFYLFDYGVKRALEGVAHLPIASTGEFGRAFEHIVMCELIALNHYYRRHYKFSHLLTKGGIEVDVIIDRPREQSALVEIKSAEHIEARQLEHLRALKQDYPDFIYVCLCRERTARVVDGIRVLPWQAGLVELGLEKQMLGK